MSSDAFVLVPSYNHAPFVSKCLRSIIEQTLRPRKLLVIDDGSTDGSPKIIEEILKTCDFESELIARENRGLCRTLNQALSLSSGKYFAYLGSDDTWMPEFLARRSELMEARDKAVLAYGHAYLINDDGEVFDQTDNYLDSWGNFPDGDARAMLLGGFSPISSTVFYRRSVIADIGWNEDARLEDYEMYLRLMNSGDFAFDPHLLSAWRKHDYNTSNDLLMMYHEVTKAQLKHIDAFGISPKEMAAVQTGSKFRYAQMLLQDGDKAAALPLLFEGWKAARSPSAILKVLIQLVTPKRILVRYRDAKRRRVVGR